jgi:hypothetical protein
VGSRRAGTILHLARSDAHRWRGLIAAWLLLAIVQRLVDEMAPMLAVALGWPGEDRVGPAVLLLTAARSLVGLVLLALIVQETPVLSRRAFLATRPVTVAATLGSTLVTLGVVFVLAPALLDAITLVWRGFPLWIVVLDALEALVGWRLIVVLALFLAAALTPNVAIYLLALPPAIGTVLVSAAVVLWLIGAPAEPDAPFAPIASQFDLVRFWLVMLVTWAAPLVVLAWRRTRRAAVTSLAVSVLLMVLANRFPMPWTVVDSRLDPPAWATEPGRIALQLDADRATTTVQWAGSPPPAERVDDTGALLAPLYLPGVPRGWAAEVVRLRSRLTLADGSTIEGVFDPGSELPSSPGRRGLSRYAAWKALDPNRFPGVAKLEALAAREPRDERSMIARLRRRTADWDRLAAAPAAFDAEVFFDVWRHRVAGTVTLDRARVRGEGSVLDIVLVPLPRFPPGLVLLVRETIVSPLLWPTTPPTYDVLLTATLARSSSELYGAGAPGTLASALGRTEILPRLFAVGAESLRTYWTLRWFSPDEVEAARRARPGPLELTILETRFAGRFSRRVHADRLRVTVETITPPLPPTALHLPLH